MINLDFADVRTIMSDSARPDGIGFASTGENRAKEAAERALRSPLTSDEITGLDRDPALDRGCDAFRGSR